MDLSRQVMTLIYGRALAFGVSLLIPIALTRLLVEAEYGTYQELVLVYATLQVFLLLGLPRSLSYYFPRLAKEERSRLVRQTLGLLSAMALASVIIFLAGQWALGRFQPDHHLQPYLGLLGVYTALMLLVAPLQNLLVVEGRVRGAAISMVAFGLVDVVVLPLSAYLVPTVWGILYGITAAAAIKALVSLGYQIPRYILAPSGMETFTRRQLAYSVPVGLAGMVSIINVNIDKYLVSFFFSTRDFAVYYIGSLWAMIFGWVALSTAQVVIPRLSAAHKEGALEDMARLRSSMARRMVLIFFPLALVLAVVARPLIEGLFTSAYSEAVPIFMLYLLVLPSRPFGYGEVLMASGQTSYLFRVVSVMAVLNVGLSCLLLWKVGLLGLPLATVFVTWLSTFAIVVRSNRILDLSLKVAYPWRYVLLTLAVSILAAFPPLGLLLLGVKSWTLLFGGVALYAATFLPLAAKAGVVGPGEWKLLKAILPPGR